MASSERSEMANQKINQLLTEPLQTKQQIKYLGVILDQRLTFAQHLYETIWNKNIILIPKHEDITVQHLQETHTPDNYRDWEHRKFLERDRTNIPI